jgi:hypothetical protein
MKHYCYISVTGDAPVWNFMYEQLHVDSGVCLSLFYKYTTWNPDAVSPYKAAMSCSYYRKHYVRCVVILLIVECIHLAVVNRTLRFINSCYRQVNVSLTSTFVFGLWTSTLVRFPATTVTQIFVPLVSATREFRNSTIIYKMTATIKIHICRYLIFISIIFECYWYCITFINSPIQKDIADLPWGYTTVYSMVTWNSLPPHYMDHCLHLVAKLRMRVSVTPFPHPFRAMCFIKNGERYAF